MKLRNEQRLPIKKENNCGKGHGQQYPKWCQGTTFYPW
jgi:hypothetical protein